MGALLYDASGKEILSGSSQVNPVYSRYYTRNDSWSNFLTGLGVAGYDKRMSTRFHGNSKLKEQELNDIYCGEGLGWRIIEVLTEDINRKPFTITGDDENKLAKELKKIKVLPKISEATRWALLHGGSIGVIGIDDGNYLDEPVNEQNIRAITHVHVFDRWRVVWTSTDLYSDPSSPKYGTPEYYTVYPINTGVITAPRGYTSMRERAKEGIFENVGYFKVHESRVMRFNGKLVPLQERIKNNYWDDSYLQGVYERLRGLGEAYAGVETVISEYILGVLRMKGFAGMIASNQDAVPVKRLQMIDQAKHILNSILLDAEEEYQRLSANVSGLSQLIDALILGLSAVTGIPVTVLMGQAPAGLNATGASDIRRYYDKISGMREYMHRNAIEMLVRYIMLSKQSAFGGKEIKDWEIEFPSLWELTEKEQAELRKTVADADAIYIDRGVLDPGEVAKSRFGGNKYSMETDIDINKTRTLPGEELNVPGENGSAE